MVASVSVASVEHVEEEVAHHGNVGRGCEVAAELSYHHREDPADAIVGGSALTQGPKAAVQQGPESIASAVGRCACDGGRLNPGGQDGAVGIRPAGQGAKEGGGVGQAQACNGEGVSLEVLGAGHVLPQLPGALQHEERGGADGGDGVLEGNVEICQAWQAICCIPLQANGGRVIEGLDNRVGQAGGTVDCDGREGACPAGGSFGHEGLDDKACNYTLRRLKALA